MPKKQYAEIDVSDWPLSGEEDLGTKPKRWLDKPGTTELWLMKDATFSEGKGNRKYRKGDDWAERIACGVAQTMGLPVAEVELAVDRRGEEPIYGTVCRSVLQDDETLINGDELLGNARFTSLTFAESRTQLRQSSKPSKAFIRHQKPKLA